MPCDKQQVAALIERFGHDTVSSQALEPGLRWWFYNEQACVIYRDTGRAWIAVGAPICPTALQSEVISKFVEAAQKANRRARFFAIESTHPQLDSVRIGLQPEWKPSSWQATLKSKASLREQLRRARAKSVSVRQVPPQEVSDPQSEVHWQVCRMVRDWQKNRAMAPMSFLVSLNIFSTTRGRRHFIAEHKGAVVALLVVSALPMRKGWFFENLLRAHDAPNGSVELLFDSAMCAALTEEREVVSFGLAPLAGEVAPWLQQVRDHSRWLYDFEGLERFKAKLLPTRWQEVYLSYPQGERGIRATIDSLTAFAGGSWVRFGVRTLVHIQPTIVWWLVMLLIPWTALLALADAELWFPNATWRASWIAFDLILALVLVRLALRWRRVLALQIALLCGCDTVVGTVQLWFFTRHQLHTGGQWLLAISAILAPLGATLILLLGAAMRDRLYLAMPNRDSDSPTP